MELKQKSEVEQITEEASDTMSIEGASAPNIEADGLKQELTSIADSFDVTGFKCTNCGLAHMHDTNKHRATDGFDISVEEAANMYSSPNCHCGYNDIAHHSDEMGVDDAPTPDQASRTAPIPDETMQEIRSR